MNGIRKPQRDGNHRASQHPEAPIQRRILLGILVDSILTNSLLGHTNQAHESRCQRLTVGTDEAFPIWPRAPHRDESFFLFIQKPDSTLVCSDGTKRLCQHAGNALRALKVMQIQKGRYNGLSQCKRWRRLQDSSIEISGSLSTLKTVSLARKPAKNQETLPRKWKVGETKARSNHRLLPSRVTRLKAFLLSPNELWIFPLVGGCSLPRTARAFRAPMQAGIPHSLTFDRLLKCAWKSWPTAEKLTQESAKLLCFFQEIRSRRSVRSAK